MRAEVNWSAENGRWRKSKREGEGQGRFLRDRGTKRGIRLEKRRNEFTWERERERCLSVDTSCEKERAQDGREEERVRESDGNKVYVKQR